MSLENSPHIIIHASKLRDYLVHLFNNYQFVPKEPVTSTTEYVMIVDVETKTDQWMIKVKRELPLEESEDDVG